MKELGVGLVYWAELEPLVAQADSGVSVVELEPQTLWELTATDACGWRYRQNEALLDRVAALPQAKLLHGVGHPLGGTVRDPLDPTALLRRAVERLDPAWVSEHLSFNRVQRARGVEYAGFLLPPPQSAAAVRVAAQNIGAFGRALGRPVAFETGVNYLRPRAGEMRDGEYFAQVAQCADSGIVLDLHNLWCNERNGRDSVADVVARMPLDRVWEMHLAGGFEEGGYWLDAHSGRVPDEVVDIAARLIPRLPNLGALIFEVLPEHLGRIGLDGVHRQIEKLRQLWGLRSPRVARVAAPAGTYGHDVQATPTDFAEVARWEAELVGAMKTATRPTTDATALRTDPGCALLRTLVEDFRRANLARTLHYVMTALLAGLGPRSTHALLNAYFDTHTPEPFGALEADRFAHFLRTRLALLPRVPYLDEVLSFEHALVRATLHGASSEIAWSTDPVALFETLDAGTLPGPLPAMHSTMVIRAA